MRWKDLRRSDNVRDERGDGRRGGGRLPLRGVGGGLGAVALLVVVFVVGGPDAVLQLLGSGSGVAPSGGGQEGAPLDGDRRRQPVRCSDPRQHGGRVGRGVRAAGPAL